MPLVVYTYMFVCMRTVVYLAICLCMAMPCLSESETPLPDQSGQFISIRLCLKSYRMEQEALSSTEHSTMYVSKLKIQKTQTMILHLKHQCL